MRSIKKILKKNVSFKTLSSIKKNHNYILGISAFYHDSSASIIKDGKILATLKRKDLQELRMTKVFPNNAINFCLEKAKINPDQLSAVVYYDNAYVTFERILWSF